MVCRVEVTVTAEAEEAFSWQANVSLDKARRWYTGLLQALGTLAQHPERCPKDEDHAVLGQDVRFLLYGKRRRVYRIIFDIREDVVYVLHIRHASRRLPLDEDKT